MAQNKKSVKKTNAHEHLGHMGGMTMGKLHHLLGKSMLGGLGNEMNLWHSLDAFHQHGLSLYEKPGSVCIEAALPGLDASQVEITLDRGMLSIRGENQLKEEKGRKYYRKSMHSYYYTTAIPSNADTSKEPNAYFKNGIMHIEFKKLKGNEPKRIRIKKK